MGVLPKLSKLDPQITVEPLDMRDWHDIVDTDIVFFERPSQSHLHAGMEQIKDFGLKIWLDFDDDFFNVPVKPFNPSGNHFNDPEIQEILIKLLRMADVITVSTDVIKKSYDRYNENVVVIPNAFNDYNYKWAYNYSTRDAIFWRGSISHRFNLKTAKDAILKVARRNREWEWNFVGEAGDDVWSEIENAKLHFDRDNVKFWKLLREIDCSIQIFPLVNDLFNQAKSNCSWIEGTYAGATMLAPDFAEYRRPGITNYSDMEEFQEELISLMSDKPRRKANYDLSFGYIRDNLMLSDVNKQRLEIVGRLI